MSVTFQYQGLITNPSRPNLRRLAERNFAGSFVNAKGESQATSIGVPMAGLAEVNLFTVKGSPTWMEYILGYPFQVEPDAERVVVPVLGEFYGQEGVITQQLEERGIIRRVVDGQGNAVQVPLFVKTMRQLYQPCGGKVRLLKIGDRLIIPNSAEAVKEAWSLIQPQGTDGLDKSVDAALEVAYRAGQAAESLEEFKKKHRPSLTLRVGMAALLRWKQPQEAGNPETGLGVGSFEYIGLPICGMGIKGAGCLRYDGHHIPFVKDESQLPSYLKVKRRFEASNAAFVVDTRFDGAKGMLLAIPHQLWSSRPVGGDSIANLLAFGRENLLLKHGAELSYVTTAVVPLLSREQVPELCARQIAIHLNAVLDDSRRISDFLDARHGLEERRQMYAAAVVEKYAPGGNAVGQAGLLEEQTPEAAAMRWTTFVEEHLEEARDVHWARLCQRIGKNLRAVFEAGLTNPANRGMVGNLSLDGGLADALDLAEFRHPREFHNFVWPVLDGLSSFYEVAGFHRSDWFSSKYFRILLESSLGAESASVILERIASFLGPGDADPRGTKRTHAIGLVTDEFVRLAGVEEKSVWAMSDKEFLALLSAGSTLRDAVGFRADSIQRVRRALRGRSPVHQGSAARSGEGVDPHEELDDVRAKADIELRARTARSLKENFSLMDEEFEQKYGGPILAE